MNARNAVNATADETANTGLDRKSCIGSSAQIKSQYTLMWRTQVEDLRHFNLRDIHAFVLRGHGTSFRVPHHHSHHIAAGRDVEALLYQQA